MPLALVRPDCRILLVESLGRKVAWLEEQVQALGLADRVEVVSRRCEDVGRDPAYRAALDAVVAKALAGLPVLVEYALPLLRIGGRLYAHKGPALAEEIGSARHALGELGGHLAESRPYRVLDRERVVCVVEKVRATPDRYPRRAGVPGTQAPVARFRGQAPIDGLRWIRRGLRSRCMEVGQTCMGVGRHA